MNLSEKQVRWWHLEGKLPIASGVAVPVHLRLLYGTWSGRQAGALAENVQCPWNWATFSWCSKSPWNRLLEPVHPGCLFFWAYFSSRLPTRSLLKAAGTFPSHDVAQSSWAGLRGLWWCELYLKKDVNPASLYCTHMCWWYREPSNTHRYTVHWSFRVFQLCVGLHAAVQVPKFGNMALGSQHTPRTSPAICVPPMFTDAKPLSVYTYWPQSPVLQGSWQLQISLALLFGVFKTKPKTLSRVFIYLFPFISSEISQS